MGAEEAEWQSAYISKYTRSILVSCTPWRVMTLPVACPSLHTGRGLQQEARRVLSLSVPSSGPTPSST